MTAEEIYREMQIAVDAAWAEPSNRPVICAYTGSPEKPTVETLIAALAAAITNR